MRSRREYRGLQVLLPYLAIFEREGYSHGSWITTAGGWEIFDFSPGTESFFHSLHDEGAAPDSVRPPASVPRRLTGETQQLGLSFFRADRPAG